MKRISINKTNLQPHFIGSWAQKNEGLCDQLIQYFERNREKHKKGTTASGVNLESKNSMDISISPKDLKQEGNEIFNTYFQNLFECYKDYMEQWPFLSSVLLHIFTRFHILRQLLLSSKWTVSLNLSQHL